MWEKVVGLLLIECLDLQLHAWCDGLDKGECSRFSVGSTQLVFLFYWSAWYRTKALHGSCQGFILSSLFHQVSAGSAGTYTKQNHGTSWLYTIALAESVQLHLQWLLFVLSPLLKRFHVSAIELWHFSVLIPVSLSLCASLKLTWRVYKIVYIWLWLWSWIKVAELDNGTMQPLTSGWRCNCACINHVSLAVMLNY